MTMRRRSDRRSGGWLVVAMAVLAIACLGGRAAAQDLSGSYTYEGTQGTVRLTLSVSGQSVSGSLENGGTSFALEGGVDAQGAFGLMHAPDGDSYFEAGLVPEGLELILASYDAATGQADASTAQRFVLQPERAGGPPAGRLLSPAGGAGAGSGSGGGAPPQPARGAALGGLGPTPSQASPDPAQDEVLARGAYGTLTRDGAEAFLEALGFVLQQIGADSVMADVDHEAAVAALAQGYPGLAQEEQLALSRAREIWTAARSGWASAPQADRQAFAMAVLVLAFGEQAVRGATPGDGGLGDAGMPSVDEQTWTDTQNAMSCWAAAGCSGYDASTDTFDYGDPGGP